jgi:RNA polymerase sigma-70 factor (ECF subfamily)
MRLALRKDGVSRRKESILPTVARMASEPRILRDEAQRTGSGRPSFFDIQRGASEATPRPTAPDVPDEENGRRERSLVSAARRGDPGAFREFYEAYRDRIWALLMYLIGDSTQAQDVMQVTFLKAFRGLGNFRFQSSLFTWLYRIARNECQNYHRGRGTPEIPLGAILGSVDEIDPRPASNGSDWHQEREIIVQNAVMQLPLKMREVVVLKYLEGLSYEEMSRALGCAPGTVASRLNRALAELEERLRPFKKYI